MLALAAAVRRRLRVWTVASGLFVATTMGCNRPEDPRVSAPNPLPSSAPFPVTIRKPDKLTSVETGRTDALGQPLRAACTSCHSQRKSETLPASASDLKEFHQGLVVEHGRLVCGQCHVVGDSTSLHLADGRKLPMTEVLELCAQCHGPQYRDYGKGAHGGMRGYWDLRRGGRTRNSCVDCHDPHAPKFQPGKPVLPPRDRGTLSAKGASHG